MRCKATVIIPILLSLLISIPGQVLADDAECQPIEELAPEDGTYMPEFTGEPTIQEKGIESVTVARSHWNKLWDSPKGEVCYEVNSRQFWWCEDNGNQ